MKNYKVEAIMKFTDKEEDTKRNVGDQFEVTKERYEYLRSKSAIKLIGIQETIEDEVENFAVTQEEDGKVHVRPVVDGEIIDTPVVKIEKPKRRKASKK